MFYQGGPIDHFTHIPSPVTQSSAEREYNLAHTSGMALAHFRVLKNIRGGVGSQRRMLMRRLLPQIPVEKS